MHLRGDKILGLASNIHHILMPKQWWFRALCTLKDEHLKSYTIKCIIKVCSFHENVSHSLGLYCHNKSARELQSETENPGQKIRFSMIVFCYKLNTKNERLFFFPFVSWVFSENANKMSSFLLSPSILYHVSPLLEGRWPQPPATRLTPVVFTSRCLRSEWSQGTQAVLLLRGHKRNVSLILPVNTPYSWASRKERGCQWDVLSIPLWVLWVPGKTGALPAKTPRNLPWESWKTLL